MDTLSDREHLYVVDGPVFAPYVLVTATPPLPTTLKPGRRRRIPLQLVSGVNNDKPKDARLEVSVRGATGAVSLQWNGRDLADVTHAPRSKGGTTSTLQARVPTDALTDGANELLVTAGRTELRIERVHLWLRPAR